MSIIQSMWIGNKLSTLERLSFISFLENGHSFHLYAYDNIENVPDGVIIKDANQIIPADKIFKYKEHDSYAGFANLFRYKLLLEKGGFWVDSDVICLKKFDFNEEHVFAGFRQKERFSFLKNHVCNCIIKAPIGSEVMKFCYENALNKNSEDLYWGQTGPVLLTEAVKKLKYKKHIKKPNIFCPVDWWDYENLINGSAKLKKESYGIHLWNEWWRRSNIDKEGVFNEDSIYEILKLKYLS